MSMGSSGGAPSTQTVTNKTEIPQYQQDYDKTNYESAQDIAARPYTTYTGERTAPLSNTQQQGIDLTKTNANDPYYTNTGTAAATDMLNLAEAPGYGGTASYTPYTGTATAGSYGGRATAGSYGKTLDPSSVAPWMSPYVEQALQPELRDIRRQGNVTQQGIDATATGAGAFGDAAHGVRSGENDRNTGVLLDDATAKGYGSAYDRAVTASGNAFTSNSGQFNTEDAARRAAFNANAGQFNTEDAAARAAAVDNAAFTKQNNADLLGVFNANAGQFNIDRTAKQTSLAGVPTALNTTYGIGSKQAADLATAGQTEQAQSQKGLDTAYQDYLNQFEYPQEMLNLRLAARQGAPYASTRLTTTPYSSSAQSIGALSAAFGLGGKTYNTMA